MLHKFISRTSADVINFVPGPLDWLDPDPLFTVLALIDHKIVKIGKRFTLLFKVNWAGFDASHNSFEPRSNLIEHVPDMVETYEQEHSLPLGGVFPASFVMPTDAIAPSATPVIAPAVVVIPATHLVLKQLKKPIKPGKQTDPPRLPPVHSGRIRNKPKRYN